MDDVLRALKQKKKLKQRYEGCEEGLLGGDAERHRCGRRRPDLEPCCDVVGADDDGPDGTAMRLKRPNSTIVAQQWAVLAISEAAHIKATDEDVGRSKKWWPGRGAPWCRSP